MTQPQRPSPPNPSGGEIWLRMGVLFCLLLGVLLVVHLMQPKGQETPTPIHQQQAPE